MPDGSALFELLADALADAEAQWSIGTFGAIAEFSRAPDEPVALGRTGTALTAVTARGGIRLLAAEGLRPVAFETTTREAWSQRLALCLPEDQCAMRGAGVLTELGPDRDALREEDREAVLFDLGLAGLQVDVCVRIADPALAARLREYAGRSVFEPGNPAFAAIVPASPPRVFASRAGRIEVFSRFRRPAGVRPEGPHTHLLPKLLGHRRTHSATEPIPDGFVPCAHLYPANPVRDGLGRVRPFDAGRHAAFQRVLTQYGEPRFITLKERVIDAVANGQGPDAVPVSNDRLARTNPGGAAGKKRGRKGRSPLGSGGRGPRRPPQPPGARTTAPPPGPGRAAPTPPLEEGRLEGIFPQSQWGVRRIWRRAERRIANPSNLIRVMPAEGAEMHAPQSDLPHIAADILARLRARRPRVHCITNAVAQAFTANMLLAAGAVPSMTIAADEIAAFVAGADALLVNLGTFDAERRAAADIAVEVAAENGGPGCSIRCSSTARSRAPPMRATLVARKPSAIRLNRAEFIGARRVPSPRRRARRFARDHGIRWSGSPARSISSPTARGSSAIENGHPLMGRVTAMGCAGSALVAACLAVEPDALARDRGRAARARRRRRGRGRARAGPAASRSRSSMRSAGSTASLQRARVE